MSTDTTSRWTEVTPGAPVHSSCGSCPPRPAVLRWIATHRSIGFG